MDNQYGISRQGIALDIDETLSWTIGFWIKEMQERFGNPENLTVKEMIEKYRYSQNVPYWQHSVALEWIDAAINSNETQETLPLIEGADDYVGQINQIIPIAAYITVRPQKVIEGTRNWLKKHGFPEAPVICRPSHIDSADGSHWKASVLKELYPGVVGIIDDNAKLLEALGHDYQGRIFLYDHHDALGFPFAIACQDWPQVFKAVKGHVDTLSLSS